MEKQILQIGKRHIGLTSTPKEVVLPIPADLEFLEEKKLTLKNSLKFSSFELISLGTVDFLSDSMIKKFYKKSYIYPVGYTIKREFWSYKNSQSRMVYTASIEEKDGIPLFVISDEEGNRVDEASSSSRVWKNVIAMINEKRTAGNKVAPVVSGPKYYGLTIPAIATLIEKYSDKKIRCIGYLGLAAARKSQTTSEMNSYSYNKRHKKQAKKIQRGKPIFAVDEKVEARFALSGYWFPGKIAEVYDNGKYTVVYDDDEIEFNVDESLIRCPQFIAPSFLQEKRRPESFCKQGDQVVVYHSDGPLDFSIGTVSQVRTLDDLASYQIEYKCGQVGYELDSEMIMKAIPYDVHQ